MSWDLSLNGFAVLVVDDHGDSRELAATVLTIAGARVSTAASGREALERLGSRWDAVVTDISMPNGSGYDLIREARRKGYHGPFIALTASDTPEHRWRIQSSGFARLLVKPLLPEGLIEAVWETVKAKPTTRTPDPATPIPTPTPTPAPELRGASFDDVNRWSAAVAPSSSARRRESTG